MAKHRSPTSKRKRRPKDASEEALHSQLSWLLAMRLSDTYGDGTFTKDQVVEMAGKLVDEVKLAEALREIGVGDGLVR